MNIPDRIIRIIFSSSHDVLIGTDVNGRLHKFDLSLNLIASSKTTEYNEPINAVVTEGDYIFTKNRRGSVAKYGIETLQPLDVYDEFMLRDEDNLFDRDEEPSPTAARGIGVANGKLFTNNGYSELVVIDIETFELLEIRKPMYPDAFIDNICTENPNRHVVGQTNGIIQIGNLESGEFPIEKSIDENNIHWIRYDKRHERFWATQDAGEGDNEFKDNGVVTFELDGSNIKDRTFTYDDVEALEFDEEHRFIYVGAFDGNIYVFDNEEKDFKLSRIIGPLKYQIINMCYAKDHLYVLLQNGELICMDTYGNVKDNSLYQGKCVWEMTPHPEDENLLFVAKDNGIEKIRYGEGKYGTVNVERLESHRHSLGIIKRVRPLKDGSYLAITQNKYAMMVSRNGDIKWFKTLEGHPRSLEVNSDYSNALIGTDAGVIYEFEIETGNLLERAETTGTAIWVTGYTKDGRKMYGTKNGDLHFYDNDPNKPLHVMQLDGVPKRWVNYPEGKTYIIGTFGFLELDLEKYEVNSIWGMDILVNTKENALVLGNHVHIISYGYQMASYTYNEQEFTALHENLPDFPKAIAGKIENGNEILLIGGRGNYINAYKVQNGVPYKVREFYLS
ncbi:WD40 repeat domain-containing protein [Halobacillus litoralis]|uniref:WD40 repeat domain-containing protein n=1 Tax=Halobacillus litoralis TaxID=45668 RepID=A0A410MJ75_9BACI|nr:WD40 repeat domain-containing protein [Halobacillus litoralis]QAS54738.1 hypothetical protein HLI_21000 [Halobacillus litoralis]